MAAAIMYVTPAGANNKDGTDWNNAFGYSEWETDFEGSAEAGDIYYVAGGTYTLTSDLISALDGIATAQIKVIGVKSGTTAEPPVAADWAFTTDRPLLTDGASAFTFQADDNWEIRNLRLTLSDSNSIRIDARCTMHNIKAENDGGGGVNALSINSTGSKMINCEGVSTNGEAASITGSDTMVFGCYLHDSVRGLHLNETGITVIYNIIDTCSTNGIEMTATRDEEKIIGNTIYNCVTGIDGNDSEHNIIYNNIIDTCTTRGISFDAVADNFLDYNNFYNNAANTSNATVGVNTLTANPLFVDADNGNFSLSSGSGCIGTGFMVTDGS